MCFSSYIDILHSKFTQKAQEFARMTTAFHLLTPWVTILVTLSQECSPSSFGSARQPWMYFLSRLAVTISGVQAAPAVGGQPLTRHQWTLCLFQNSCLPPQ